MYLFFEDGEVTQHEELPGGIDLLDYSDLTIIHVDDGLAKQYVDGEWLEIGVE